MKLSTKSYLELFEKLQLMYSKGRISFDKLIKRMKVLNRYSVCIIVCLVAWILTSNACAEIIDVNLLANAIYKAENSTTHPYGILQHYKHTTPRQACINTIRSGIKRFNKQTKEKDFIHFLSLTYCPVGASNDPKNLNKNWEKNVKYYYNKP